MWPIKAILVVWRWLLSKIHKRKNNNEKAFSTQHRKNDILDLRLLQNGVHIFT
jgi:hypothetical protein